MTTEVSQGEILILTGPSGSGKTTLLTLMGALRAVQSGSVRILGQELRGEREGALVRVRRQIGYIFQSHNLLKALSVEQNVRMAIQLGELRKLPRSDQLSRIREVLDRVGLVEHIQKPIDQLSAGQRQRVAIARALVNRPRIVLADEPTASLDKQSGRDVVDLIQQLAREQGASVVLVTHDNRILDVADRILHLEDGTVRPLSDAVASDAGRMLQILAANDPAGYQQLMAFATCLARVAHADRNITEDEVDVIRRVLTDVADLGPGGRRREDDPLRPLLDVRARRLRWLHGGTGVADRVDRRRSRTHGADGQRHAGDRQCLRGILDRLSRLPGSDRRLGSGRTHRRLPRAGLHRPVAAQ